MGYLVARGVGDDEPSIWDELFGDDPEDPETGTCPSGYTPTPSGECTACPEGWLTGSDGECIEPPGCGEGQYQSQNGTCLCLEGWTPTYRGTCIPPTPQSGTRVPNGGGGGGLFSSSGGASSSNAAPWIIGGVVLLGMAGIGYWYWKGKR